jgi:hypothetical protein
MSKIIKTIAEASWKSCRREILDNAGRTVGIENEGQSCITLTPRWSNWGSSLEDGTKLVAGKHYKITIEVEE